MRPMEGGMMQMADVKGARFAYTREGMGIPLICLHGGMGVNAASLRVPGIVGLVQRGCEVMIFDQRGHGDSSTAAPSGYTHEVWATDVFNLAHHFGWNKFALLGHSYGGFIALEYATRWPESLNGLVLVSTSAGPVAAEPASCFTGQDLRDYFARRWPEFFAGSDKHWEVFNLLRFSAAPYRAAFTHELPGYDLRPKVRTITVPTLLIVGSEDHYRPHMQWLAEELPSASLRVLANVGHFPFLEAPEAFLQIVSTFLLETVLPQAGAGTTESEVFVRRAKLGSTNGTKID
jgi:proline iminopeptidase